VAGGSDSSGREPGIRCERSSGCTIRWFTSETRSERVVCRRAGPGGRATAVHRRRRKSATQTSFSCEEPQLGARSTEKSETAISKKHSIKHMFFAKEIPELVESRIWIFKALIE